MVVDFIKWYIQLAEHCKQATTETLTTETKQSKAASCRGKAARVRVSRQSLRAGTASN